MTPEQIREAAGDLEAQVRTIDYATFITRTAALLYQLAVTVEADRRWTAEQINRLESRMGEGGGRWPEH